MAELKRINNLHRDNEIFARRTIRVPFRAFLMAGVHRSGDSSPNSILLKKSVNPSVLKEKLASVSPERGNSASLQVNDNVLPSSSPLQGCSVNDIVFNTQLSESNINAESEDEELSDEEVQLLPRTVQRNTTPTLCDLDCSGSDWGISWPILITIILLVAFIVPFLYIVYMYENHEHEKTDMKNMSEKNHE